MSRYQDWKKWYLSLSDKERKEADIISMILDIGIPAILIILFIIFGR